MNRPPLNTLDNDNLLAAIASEVVEVRKTRGSAKTLITLLEAAVDRGFTFNKTNQNGLLIFDIQSPSGEGYCWAGRLVT